MTATTIRHSLLGALVFGGAVFFVSSIQAYRAGASFPEVAQPIAFFVFLAATIGALTGPLFGGALARIRKGTE